MSLGSSLRSKAEAFEKLKREAPPIIGNMGQNLFRSSFENQGFTDEKLDKWPEVERRKPGTDAYKYPKRNAADRHKRSIMIGLRTKGGIHLRDSTNRSLKIATWQEILFAVPQKYAQIHNEGLAMKNGKKMPQRKFMGHSALYMRKIDEFFAKQFKAFPKG